MMNKLLTITIGVVPALFFCALQLDAQEVAKAASFKKYVEPWLTRAPFEASKEGDLRMVIDINEDGTVADWLVIRSFDQDFVDAIRRVIDEWTFNPATLGGKPIPIVMELMFNFSKRGTSLVEGNLTELYLERLPNMHKDLNFVRSFTELDKLPEPVKIVRPVVNPDIPAEQRTGRVVVGFYIDETGKVRIPIVEEYEGHRAIVDAAYTAIRQWEFMPPTVKGKPVTVRVEQPFEFKS